MTNTRELSSGMDITKWAGVSYAVNPPTRQKRSLWGGGHSIPEDNSPVNPGSCVVSCS